MDRIKQQLDMLAELSDEDVAQLQTDIVGEFETVEKEDPTPQTVDAMTSLADMLDTVRSEVSFRVSYNCSLSVCTSYAVSTSVLLKKISAPLME